MWNTIVGQEQVILQLKEALRNKELSHAYLFVGSEGVGKQETAKAFAAAVNCGAQGCGRCPTCQKILHDLHPDISCIEPEGNYFVLEQVRELQHEVELKPFEAPTKFYILSDADKMNQEAANALLKTLEEPTGHIVFVLLAANLDSLLPTIVSRCQVVRFGVVSRSSLVDFLASRYHLREDDAQLLARLSGGVLSKAVQFAESDSKFEQRKLAINIIEEIHLANNLELIDAAEKIITAVKKPLDRLKKEHKKELEEAGEVAVNSAHAKRVKIILDKKYKRRINREERQNYNEVLSVFSSWYRDLVVLQETFNQDMLINIDQLDVLRKQCEYFSSINAQGAIEVVQETKRRLKSNANPQLALETMLLELKSLTRPA